MQLAIIGLGRMGKKICEHLLEQGVSVVAYNRSREKVDEVVAKGAISAYSLQEVIEKSKGEQLVVLLYLPAGDVTQQTIDELTGILPQNSIIIDGGNSFFKDSQRRYSDLKNKGFHFLDMGTSGGLEGARTGACLMVGGDEAIYKQVEPYLKKIATKDGYGYFGPSGAGHFVKMVHNAVEYGMMGAIGEGFNLVQSSEFQPKADRPLDDIVHSNGEKFEFNLKKLARVWAHGSIVSGLLMDKAASALAKDPKLDLIDGVVPRGETETEMEWLDTIGIPNPVIQMARKERVETRTKPSFIGKVIAALRREFGGHTVEKKV